jgi:tetratricopeptide (TPR) repeat protein
MDHLRLLERYPLPLARSYRRFRNAAEARERHDAAYYLFEVYLKYLASVATAGYLRAELRDHRVNSVLKGFARPSLGEWRRALCECLRWAAEDDSRAPLLARLAAFHDSRESTWPEVVRLNNEAQKLRGAPGERKRVSLEDLLEEVVVYRNRVLGHGAQLDSAHYERFGSLFGAAFSEVLEHSGFLLACPLVSFASVRVESGPRFECAVIEHMGLHPLRRDTPLVLAYGTEPPEGGRLYLLAEEAGGFLPLAPLLIPHADDVYFLNEARGHPEYLSYATGDHHRPADLREQAQLLESILGYEIEEDDVTRIGEEIAAALEVPEVPGAERLGDYRLCREVGRGGMGTVFEAVQVSLGRRVALKILPGGYALDGRRLERFRREARATARIHHPNIVPVYEVGEAEGVHFYSMEYIDGPNLAELIERERCDRDARAAHPRDPKRPGSSDPATIALHIAQFAAIAEGLAEAHRLGLVHRDIKPANILVDRNGRHVLVDFGLVHDLDSATITRSGELLGTLRYMSPEQLSRRPAGTRSDIFSLGATLYEVLTLAPPFTGATERDIESAILFQDPVLPRRHNPRLHRDIETILLKALEKNPERRYSSAEEFAADLRRFLRYEPIRAGVQSRWSRLGRRLWRQKTRLAIGGVIVALAAAAGVVSWKYREAGEGARLQREEYDRARNLAAAESLLWSARKLHAEGRYGEALEQAEASLQRAPDDIDARLLHARLLFERERSEEAVERLHELLELDLEAVQRGAAHCLLAAIHQGSDPERAEEHRREAEEILPRSAEACFLRAGASRTLEESVGWLDQALDIDPAHFASVQALVLAHYTRRDHEKMASEADRALSLRPRDPWLWSLRGLARSELGWHEEALRDHDRAIDLAPDDARLFHLRREAHERLGNPAAALADARRAAELAPEDVEYRFQAAFASLRRGNFQPADEELAKSSGARDAPDFRSWLTKRVFDVLAAGDELDLPAEPSSRARSQVREAESYYRSLAATARRVVPDGWRASFSPDNRSMVFSRGRPGSNGLELIDLESGRRRLLCVPGKDPMWSPSGEHIAFVREHQARVYASPGDGVPARQNQGAELWLVRPDGSGLRRVARGGSPSWSTDPERLYFRRRQDSALCRIDPGDPQAEPTRICTAAISAAISPDGKLLAYAHDWDQVQVIELAAGRVIASWDSPDGSLFFQPQWSPDGRELSIGGNHYRGAQHLWIADLQSKALWRVLEGPPCSGGVTRAFWSPDGSQIAFDVRLHAVPWELWVAPVDYRKPTWKSFAGAVSLEDYIEEQLRALEPAAQSASAPERIKARARRGELLWRMGREEEALGELNAAIEEGRQPQAEEQQALAHARRAEIYTRRGEWPQAVADYEAYRERLMARTARFPARRYRELAWTYLARHPELRDGAKGLELAQEAVRLEPANVAFRVSVGLAYFRLGRFQETIDTLAAALSLADFEAERHVFRAFVYRLFILAGSYLETGRRADAERAFEEGVRAREMYAIYLSPELEADLETLRAAIEEGLQRERPQGP